MLTFEQAKKIGLDACIEKLGKEFVRNHAETTSSAYGEHDEEVYCFVGVSTGPRKSFNGKTLRLSSDRKPAYRASCNVSLKDGSTTFIECVLPQ